MRRLWLVAAMACAAGTTQAQAPDVAACVAPGPTPADSERPPPMPPKPIMPKCINPRSLLGRCPEPVGDAYRAQVKAYNDAVRTHSARAQAFADHLNAWGRQVQAYSQCEIDRLNADDGAN